jgi:phage gp45-like
MKQSLVTKVDDSTLIQTVSLKAGYNEVFKDIERVQSYGLTTNPPLESEALYLDDFAIVVDNADFRPTDLVSGEVCLYSEFGKNIKLTSTNEIEIGGNTDYAVKFNALKATLESMQSSLNLFINVFNEHVHVVSGTAAAKPVPPAIEDNTSFESAKVSIVRLP